MNGPSAADRLAAIEARHGEWYAEEPVDYTGPRADWSNADDGETLDHCIVRNDVLPMIEALRAVLALVEPRHDGNFTDGPSYVETYLVRDAIEEALS